MMTKDERIRFTLRIPTGVYKQLSQTANKKGIAVNSEILDVLWNHIQKLKG